MPHEIDTIPESKQLVVDGACFGYYDEKFTACLECRIGESCKNASLSEKRDEVRAIAKTTDEIVKSLVMQFE